MLMLQTTTGRLLDVNKGDVLLTKSGVYVELIDFWTAGKYAIIRARAESFTRVLPLTELNLEFTPSIASALSK